MLASSAHVNTIVLRWRGAAGYFVAKAIENPGERDYILRESVACDVARSAPAPGGRRRLDEAPSQRAGLAVGGGGVGGAHGERLRESRRGARLREHVVGCGAVLASRERLRGHAHPPPALRAAVTVARARPSGHRARRAARTPAPAPETRSDREEREGGL